MALGRWNEEAAAELGIKERTVRFHLDNLFRKFGVESRTELIHAAQEQGWLTS